MKQKSIKAERVYSSDYKRRIQELKNSHEEFLRMVEEGWQVESVTHRRRPRIKKENFKIVMVFGKPMRLTIQEYNDHWVVAFGK